MRPGPQEYYFWGGIYEYNGRVGFASGHSPMHKILALRTAIAILVFTAGVAISQAQIYQWQYIDPADPNQGKDQSSTLAPDGAYFSPSPGLQLFGKNLTKAYL